MSPDAGSRCLMRDVGEALVIVALAVCTACSTGSDPTSGGLTLTREDGSIVEFGDVS